VSSFEKSLLVLGALLVVGALVSGVARRSFLALTPLFVIAGFLIGDGALGVLDFDPRSSFVQGTATVALIVILFRDGLEVDAELLQREWHIPLRKLVLAMPITTVIVTLAARTFTDLSWTESFLVGALLAPTDPVLSSGVVTNPRVPRSIRHSLNLESGMNDGLALPAVLAFSAALSSDSGDFVWWRFVLEDVTLGLVFGLALGALASVLMPRGRNAEGGIPDHQKSLYALGVAFATYGVAIAPPHGNGFIAVYVAAIVLGTRRADIRECFSHLSEDIVEIVKLGVFVVFGALLSFGDLFHDGWAAVGIVLVALLVARPVAIAVALAGTGTDRASRAFMAWFGPKGVATIAFSLLVLGRDIAAGQRIFDLAALAVFSSILAHGLTDTPGVNWIARQETAPPRPPRVPRRRRRSSPAAEPEA
jgi:NhaP-type Na+/H+ or K+/H+ antiporter